jgi:Zn-dependent protease with chaperone function
VTFEPGLPDDRVNVSDEHPVREALVLVAGLVGVATALFVAIALAIDLLVPLVPARFEARVFGGSWVDALVLKEEDAPPDPRTPVVARLLDRIAAHGPLSPYRYRVALLDDATPNAMAFPGGLIIVTTGLIDGVASENELAFVLGHELGHFHNRDHLRGLGRGLAIALVTSGLGLSGAAGAAQLASLSGALAERGFGREQELDADRFSLELVYAEYGHTAGATGFFEHSPAAARRGDERIADWFSTHPLDDDRIEALDAIARERGWPSAGTPVPLPPPTPDAGGTMGTEASSS